MKISALNISYSPNFAAKNKEIKQADDICRAAKREFPMLSSTYALEKYGSCDRKSKYFPITSKGLDLISSKVKQTREDLFRLHTNTSYRGPWSFRDSDALVSTLDIFKKYKAGNCSENGQLALAALYANGYYNSQLVDLHYKAQAVNKNGEILYSYSPRRGLDHVFAITDMDKGGKKDIIVDPWLGFADSFSKSFDKFQDIYLEDTEKIKSKCDKKIQTLQKLKLKRQEDYQIRGTFFVRPLRVSGLSSNPDITGEKIRNKYPNLVVREGLKGAYNADSLQ